MDKKIIIIIISCLLLVIVGVFIICGANPSIVGAWKTSASVIGYSDGTENTEVLLTFNDNGTAVFSNILPNGKNNDTEFEYKIKDNMITVILDDGSVYSCEYTLKKDILTINYNERNISYSKVN